MISGASFEAVWNALPAPTIVIGPENRIEGVNPAAEDFLSMSQRFLTGKPLTRFVSENSTLIDLIQQARNGVVSMVQHNVDFAWADRPPRLSNVNACALGERPGYILLQVVPKSLAEKMDRSLSHRNSARSVIGMAGMLAHEIKNPLAGISGAAQLLEMSLDDADHELTQLIQDETKRIEKLLSRVDQFGDVRPTAQKPVNIHDILNRAKLSAKAGFASHVRFIEEYDPSIPPTVGDADQLMQVALNLLKNAAEATPRVGGIITLRTGFKPGVKLALPGGRSESLPLQVTISDNGSGVPEDLINDIFDPFVSSKANGSGLGLALVSKIIADHGGVVECNSDPGWTTFRLMLPIYQAEPRVRKQKSKLGG